VPGTLAVAFNCSLESALPKVISAGLFQLMVGVVFGTIVTPTVLLAALVTPLTVCLAVSVWPPRASETAVLKFPLPSAVVVAIRLPASKIETEAPAVAVPLTVTLVLAVERPVAGEVIAGGRGVIVTPTAALAALATLLTVCLAVSECTPTASETDVLKLPPPSAVVEPI